MDPRTREKYRAQVRIMAHLFDGHRGQLPAGTSLTAAIADGMAAANALGLEIVAGEARAMAGRTSAVGRGVEALYSGPAMPPPSCGIERSLPRGDAQ